MTWTREGQVGFEMQTLDEVVGQWSTTPGTISSTKANTGTYSMRWNLTTHQPVGFSFDGALQGRCIGFLNHNGLATSAEGEIVSAELDDAEDISVIYFKADETLRLHVRGVEVDSIVSSIGGFADPDTWRSVALVCFIDPVVGWASFYIDGIQRMTYSGDTGSDTIVGMFFGGRYRAGAAAWASSCYGDDFYVDTSDGTEPDEAVPPLRFLWSPADGNGPSSQWDGSDGNSTDNYLLVDDAPPDGDTTFVYTSTVNEKDVYATAAITVPVGYTLQAAIPTALAKRSSTTEQIRLVTHDGATYQNGADQDLPTSYTPMWERFTTQPDASAWDETDFNNSSFGAESRGTF